MKQPGLGRKISELRNTAKMTQAELAEKCSLSIRTVQRIESGFVNPRSFTVKAIFTGLDYDFREFVDSKPIVNESVVVNSKVYHIYEFIIDLFNLKTNTMKKVKILSVISCAILAVLLLSTIDINAQKSRKIDYSKYLTTASREIIYFFPKGELKQISNVMDTADFILRKALVQEYKNNIYLNGIYVGKALKSDTVIYRKKKIIIKSYYSAVYNSSSGQGISYYTPKNIPIVSVSGDRDTANMHFGNHLLQESNFKIFLDGIYQGKVKSGDLVLF